MSYGHTQRSLAQPDRYATTINERVREQPDTDPFGCPYDPYDEYVYENTGGCARTSPCAVHG